MNFVWEKVEKTIRWFVRLLGKVLHRDVSDERSDILVQFVKFGLVGLSNTIISYLINVLVLIALSKQRIAYDYVIGNIAAFVISVLWSFYWNNKYVFVMSNGEERSLLKALLKTYVAYAFTGIVLNNLLSYAWINWFHISKYLAPIINLIVSVPLNFILNRLWAFKTEGVQ